MAAVLSADMQNTDKVVTLIEECRAMGLKIVPPDINKGQFNFTVNEADEIVYGLGAIKGLGEGARRRDTQSARRRAFYEHARTLSTRRLAAAQSKNARGNG